MSKTDEERRKEEVEKAFSDAVKLYCEMNGCPPEWAKEPFRLLNMHAMSACLVVAMLGPKLDAIRDELADLREHLDDIPKVER